MRTPGRSRAACRARCCARWARWACSGSPIPQEYGGAQADALTSLVFAEALSRSTFGGFVVTVLVHTDMASPHLVHAGTREQLQRYLPGVIAGELITAVGITEPDAGSDVAGLRTRARREGGQWVLNGTKMFITNGVHADLYFIAARTDPDAKGSRGISMFIVEKGTPGFRVGRALKKTGWLCSDTAELVFDDCRIPEGNLLGEENAGFYAVMKNFQTERIALSAMAVGHCMTGAGAHARLRAHAQGLRRDAVRQAGRSASGSPCSRPRPKRRASSCTTARGW